MFERDDGNELTGRVQRLRYVDESSHWTVATLASDKAGTTTIVGHLPGVREGMDLRLTGQWVRDAKYGRQFRASTYAELVPATLDGVTAYLASGFIPGIGSRMAGRIVEHLGAEALNIIAETPERLREVPGLGKKRVEQIVSSFRERRGAQTALVFLYGLEITPGLANRIYQRYGDDTVGVVRANPYRLAEEVHGIGFQTADRVARGLKIGHDHPARSRAACYHCLLAARSDGHCFLPRGELVSRAVDLLSGGSAYRDGPLAEEADVVSAVTALAMDGKVKLSPSVEGDESVYLGSLYDAERGLAIRLASLLASPVTGAEASRRVEAASQRLGIELAPGQRGAVQTVLERGTAIITGGPGTGKTTIIRALLEALDLAPTDIALAAPTGRAAKRMGEATGHEAKTLHRLLAYSPVEHQFQRNEMDPLEVGLVIVDEASMLDVPLFWALIRALPAEARLVLVGDVDQLPPVGPGSPFGDLVRSGLLPVARLTEIFRQGAGSAIVETAHAINSGNPPVVSGPKAPLSDFYFIEREEPEAIASTIERLVKDRIPGRWGFDPIRDVQILAPMRSGIIGVEQLNIRLQALLNPKGEELTVGKTTYRIGDKVMQIRNDYDRNVFNGDVGYVHQIQRKDRRVIVAIDNRPIVYERDQLDQLVLAYAVSVHKSQGSEYPAVVIPVSTQHYMMLRRNLLYTAVTRGKELVVLVGSTRAARIAVQRADVAMRNSRLVERLRDALERG